MNISHHTERPIYSSQVSLDYDGLFIDYGSME